MRVLIANRGEIARRVMRTAHRLGHETVAVYADPDASAPFVREATQAVRIGPAALHESYLAIDRIIEAATATDSDAVHPGYGFLSENVEFARAVIDAELIWVGPHPDAIDQMGSKIDARRLAQAAGVPVIPGFDEAQDDEVLAEAANRVGYPVLVKAAAGGGGKGIRIAHSPERFSDALNEARAEAQRSFGDSQVIVERYIQRPRHIEVQVVGDAHGGVIELGTRECSVQRRYQKLLEEAPAPNLPAATVHGLRDAAASLARSIGYDSTGTVEFIVDDDTGDYFFLEMNTRLQVEHPVTEAITGLDLVELQFRSAQGDPLPLDQGDVRFQGHAIEARINAEDATLDFAPQTGSVTLVSVPPGVRWDSGVDAGSEITPHYDPMIAKLIVHHHTRDAARRALIDALDNLLIGGVVTNTGFHRWLLDQPEVIEASITTRFLDETDVGAALDTSAAPAAGAAAWWHALDERSEHHAWHALATLRLTPHERVRTLGVEDLHGQRHEITRAPGRHEGAAAAAHVDQHTDSVVVNVDGQSHTFRVLSRSERWAPPDDVGHGHAGAIVAPFPAVVTEVPAAPGVHVAGGDAVVVIEAMKMLHTLAATGPGTVDEVRVQPGDQVATNQVLVTFTAAEDDHPNPRIEEAP